MLPPFRTRRAAGLLAGATIGLSTAVLGVPGVASAAAPIWTFTTGDSPITVPQGVCSVEWTITGGAGGLGDTGQRGQLPGVRMVKTVVAPGEVFTLVPGGAGADYSAGGQAGTNALGQGGGVAGDVTTGGGGGGAASLVTKGGEVFLASLGGYGGGTGGGAGGYVPDSPRAEVFTDGTLTVPPPGLVGTGSISGEGYACDVLDTPPATPYVSAVPGPGQLSVWASNNQVRTPGIAPVSGYEYSLDGGPWTAVAKGSMVTPIVTLTGLTNGREYGVRVRATSSAGPSQPSAVVTATPFERPGKPTGVTVAEKPSALVVSWSPPTAAGTYAVAGYAVTVLPADSTEGDGSPEYGCETDANARSCRIAVPSGVKYTVYVSVVDDHEFDGDYQYVASGLVPAQDSLPEIPQRVPEKDADLLGSSGPIEKVVAGKDVVIKGSGYAPFSTVRALVYSTPQELKTFVTDANGDFEATVTIPADLPAGEHSLVVQGLDPAGNVRTLRVDVTVSAAGATITSAVLATASDELAYTGFSVAGPLLGGGAAIALGGGLIVAARRRMKA